jgi:3-isopropylmalate/(R)-2-methylmalate dehydratase small subunit
VTPVRGRALPLRGDDIDTDRIIPARFLRTVTFEGLGRHLFEDDRRAGPHPLDDPRFSGASLLLVNANFGCGSSREHAPQSIQRWGIRAIVGESFAEIFFGNSTMIGMPCVTAAPADLRALMDRVEARPDLEIRLDIAAGVCEADGFSCPVSLPAKVRDALLTGAWDTTGMLLERFEEVEATAARLPYVTGFRPPA